MDKILDKYRQEGREIEIITLSTGQEVTIVGKLDVKRLVKKALAELS